jgi:aspartyl-tRNA(Asn)/glutamyl-tRNA(Gln) amidotransferase subunit A
MTVPASLAGICGLSVPCGFSEGLPVGMQILGPQFGEDRILQVGYAFEKETEWGSRHPDLA